MKLNLGPIKEHSSASWDDRRQVCNCFWNIQQRRIQNILGPTVNGNLILKLCLTPTNPFFWSYFKDMCTQTRRAEWFNLTFNRSHWAETGKICSKSHSLQIHSFSFLIHNANIVTCISYHSPQRCRNKIEMANPLLCKLDRIIGLFLQGTLFNPLSSMISG